MTAPNHALTGAVIGASIANPWLALPLAFASHFVLDAIPHYDVPGESDEARIDSKLFFQVQLVGGFLLCLALVGGIWLVAPEHWLVVSAAAFLGASPDLLSVPRYLAVKHGDKDPKHTWWFWRMHSYIQWKTGPKLWMVEAAWASGMMILLWKSLG